MQNFSPAGEREAENFPETAHLEKGLEGSPFPPPQQPHSLLHRKALPVISWEGTHPRGWGHLS